MKYLLFGFFCSFSFSVFGQKMEKETPILEKKLEKLRLEWNVAGMSAGLVKGGELVWSKGFGYADREKKIVPDTQTNYYVSSITKCFAAVIAMQLTEKQALDLEKKAKNYGVVAPNPEAQIKHLLSHTALAPAGTRFAYSTRNFTVLDQVFQKITKKNFNELVIEQIINPLKLPSCAPYLLNPQQQKLLDYQEIIKKMAVPYAVSNGNLVRGRYPNFSGAGAGLLASVAGLARFSVALDKNELISKNSWQTMTTEATNGKQNFPYGLGFFLTTYKNEKIIWHYGYWDCNSSILIKIPSKDITFILLSNSEGLAKKFDPQMIKGDLLICPAAKLFLDWVWED